MESINWEAFLEKALGEITRMRGIQMLNIRVFVLGFLNRKVNITSWLLFPLRESRTWKVRNCVLLLVGVLCSKRNRYSFTESSAFYLGTLLTSL